MIKSQLRLDCLLRCQTHPLIHVGPDCPCSSPHPPPNPSRTFLRALHCATHTAHFSLTGTCCTLLTRPITYGLRSHGLLHQTLYCKAMSCTWLAGQQDLPGARSCSRACMLLPTFCHACRTRERLHRSDAVPLQAAQQQVWQVGRTAHGVQGLDLGLQGGRGERDKWPSAAVLPCTVRMYACPSPWPALLVPQMAPR